MQREHKVFAQDMRLECHIDTKMKSFYLLIEEEMKEVINASI